RTWLKGLQLGLQQHDVNTQLRCNLGLGKVFFGMNDFRNARRYHLAATELSYLAKSPEQICEVYLCLGVDFIRLYEYDKAYSSLKISETNLAKAQHPQRNYCEIKAYLGMVHSGLGQFSLALECFEAATLAAKQQNYIWGLALTHLEHAKALAILKRNDQAINIAQQAAIAAKAMNSLAFSTQAHELMYQIYKDQNQFELALEQHIIYTEQHLEKMRRSQNHHLSATTTALLKQTHNFQELEVSLQENVHLVNRLEKHQVLIQQLTSKAETDALTGLFNRRALDARIEREVELALQLQQPFSILMLDLDFFKRVNDLYSHQAGDRVLKEAANILIQTCRQGEFVARFGGEEFTVLLPGADLAAAMRIAERILSAIESFVWARIVAGLPQQTVSIGAASRQIDELAEPLLARADAKLYEAKHTGRNKVCG
ncbi:MAG: GGDEF domain-containing protein, partial [Deefgea sp.]